MKNLLNWIEKKFLPYDPNYILNICMSRKRTRKAYIKMLDLPDGRVYKNLPANAQDMGSIPGSGRFHMLQSN